MSTPNNPLRYSIENDGTGAALGFEAICATIMSEGGQEPTGLTRFMSMDDGYSNANSTGTLYALVGLRLQASKIGCTINLISATLLAATSDDYMWTILSNPVVAGTFAYSAETNSCLELATGDTGAGTSSNTVTGGTRIAGGYVKAGNNSGGTQEALEHAWHLGASVAGVRDTLVLCAMPMSSNLDIRGGISVRESL